MRIEVSVRFDLVLLVYDSVVAMQHSRVVSIAGFLSGTYIRNKRRNLAVGELNDSCLRSLGITSPDSLRH